MRRFLPLLIAACALAAPAAHAETAYEERVSGVKKLLGSDDPKQRARAFDPMRDSADPRAVAFLLDGVDGVLKEQDGVRAAQAAAEKAYEGTLNDQERNRKRFAQSAKTSRDVDRYNSEERRISKASDEALAKLQHLENEFLRTKSQIDNAVQAMGTVLLRIPSEALVDALTQVEKRWLLAPKPPEAPFWGVDALAAIDRPWVSEALRKVVRQPSFALPVRGAALVALAERKDALVHELAIPVLAMKPEEFVLVDAAIEALRTAHARDSILPLIDFLKREDIKSLRDHAQHALMSLTGQEHGPYYDPWHSWWDGAQATFTMPPKPVVLPRGQEKGGVTFYGIHTFSDRILFILDVSGSMEQDSKPSAAGASTPAGKEPRIAVARREIAAAVNSLDNGSRFNLVLFNHEVIPWQPRISVASESTRRQGVRWALDQEPSGGTNIHDALEEGFRMAQRVTGQPDIDTIMFMTDGRPTAGKIRDPKAILDNVREWNRTARLTIHCIGIGEHDEAFLKSLADIGHGEYVKR